MEALSPIQRLPLELFLDVTSQLSPVDSQCLRLTCHGFRDLILPSFSPTAPEHHTAIRSPSDFFLSSKEQLDLLTRLGDFHRGKICYKCLHVRPQILFGRNDMLVDGGAVCASCRCFLTTRFPTLRGRTRNRKFHTCSCRGVVEEGVDAHKHAGEWMCSNCHMEACNNSRCRGWPAGFVGNHEEHFYKKCEACDGYHISIYPSDTEDEENP